MNCAITEIFSDQLATYKKFLSVGLIENADNFRLSVNDDLHAPFPTKDKPDSFTLGAYCNNQLAGIVSFARDGADREKLRHKGLLFRMYIAKEYRGMRIGRQLIEDLLARVKNLPT